MWDVLWCYNRRELQMKGMPVGLRRNYNSNSRQAFCCTAGTVLLPLSLSFFLLVSPSPSLFFPLSLSFPPFSFLFSSYLSPLSLSPFSLALSYHTAKSLPHTSKNANQAHLHYLTKIIQWHPLATPITDLDTYLYTYIHVHDEDMNV